jgi:outer membrane murein-binding lipoprotein Lpp
MNPRAIPILAALLVAALLGVSVLAVLQARSLDAERARVGTLDAEVAALRTEVDLLREEVEAAAAAPPDDRASADGDRGDDEDATDSGAADLGGLLEGLLGDGGQPDLGRLLEGLLGAGGDADVGGLLEGLLGDGGEGLGGLFAAGDAPGARCLLPTGDDPMGMLGGLLGGGGTPAGNEDPDDLVRMIADQVADLRELEWQDDVEVAFLDDVATRARLQELLEEEGAIDREALAVQERLLTALRAIPAGTDLEELQLALLEDSVAGFYVSDTGELVVRVPDDGRIRGIDRITIAHELQHALADQALGLPDPTEPPLSEDADATLATLAVVEGDATLVMQRWGLEHVSLMEQLGAFGDPDMLAAQAALDDVPHVLQRELMSPYLDGLDWVCDRYLEGGWAAVDEAYRSPPTTTAEVLFGEPVDPVEPTSLGAPRGFDEMGAITFGAAPLLWLFEAPGDDVARALDDPEARAMAWGGGVAEVWARGDDTAVGLALADRSGAGAPGLCASVGDFVEAAYPDWRELPAEAGRVWRGPDGVAVLRCEVDDILLGLGPDLVSATTIAAGRDVIRSG